MSAPAATEIMVWPRTIERWTETRPAEVAEWNMRLLNTEASYMQYPYFSESYRRLHFQPNYLAWYDERNCDAYVCILTVGVAGLRVGIVPRGPISLNGMRLPDHALQALYIWAKRNHYVFLRFTHSDAELLDRIATVGPSERRDGFPLYTDTGAADHELVVNQLPDDAQMLASFDREARRKIRRASEVGYTIEVDDAPEFLQSVWPLFMSCAKRKGFELYRPPDAYMEIVRLARPYKCVRIYIASLRGVPVEALFIIRDRSTAFCYLAALQLDRLQGKPSPSVLLHWRAMRDLYHEGCRYYSFGPGEGGVGQFKMLFSPQRVTYPPPVTLIINQPLYDLWSVVKPSLLGVWPTLKLWIAKTIH